MSPINPGPYEPRNESAVSVPRRGPSGGVSGSIQQGFIQPTRFLKSPAIKNLTGLIENAGNYFQMTADAEAKLAKANLDADVDMAHQRIKVGQDLIAQELKRNGEYAMNPRQYYSDYIEKQNKLLKDVEGSVAPEGHQSLARKAYADVLQGRFHAIQHSDELLKNKLNLRLEGWERLSQETAAWDPTNVAATESGERFKDHFEYRDSVQQMVRSVGLPVDKAEKLIEKNRHDVVRSWANSMLRADPQMLYDKLTQPADQTGKDRKGWLGYLPEQEQTSFVRQAHERINEQDRMASKAEEKRKKAMEDDATRTLTSLVVENNVMGARAQLNYYRTTINAVDDQTWRTWDALLTAAEDRSKKVNMDPWIALQHLAAPEKADLNVVAQQWKDGKLDESTAKTIIMQKRQHQEKMEDRNWSEAVRESREVINRTFGYSPFLEFKNDPRQQAHLQAITEFNDGTTRLNTPDEIRNLREEVIKRQDPVMKISINDRLEALRRSIPAYQRGLGVEENMGLFESNIRARPGLYNDERVKFYRKTFREIMQWESILDSQGATDHGRTPGGTDKAPAGGARKY